MWLSAGTYDSGMCFIKSLMKRFFGAEVEVFRIWMERGKEQEIEEK